MSLKYGIIDTGAIGGYYGGKLANGGKEVHFLFHSDCNYSANTCHHVVLTIQSILSSYVKIFQVAYIQCIK